MKFTTAMLLVADEQCNLGLDWRQAPVLLSQEKVHARVPVASKAHVLLVSWPAPEQRDCSTGQTAC